MSNIEPEISVIIPVFREEKSIGQVVEKTRAVLKSLKENFEVVVINDGSDDASAEKARRAGARARCICSHVFTMHVFPVILR